MNLMGGFIGLLVVYLVWPAVHDWWRARRRVVDPSHQQVRDALRCYCDSIDLPPFTFVMPPSMFYDGVEEGWVA